MVGIWRALGSSPCPITHWLVCWGRHLLLRASVSSPEPVDRVTPASRGGLGVTLSRPHGGLTQSGAQSEPSLDGAAVPCVSQAWTSMLCRRGLGAVLMGLPQGQPLARRPGFGGAGQAGPGALEPL